MRQTITSKRIMGISIVTIIKLGILVVVAVLLFYYTNFFKSALIDDSYITLQYADTLLDTGRWGFPLIKKQIPLPPP